MLRHVQSSSLYSNCGRHYTCTPGTYPCFSSFLVNSASLCTLSSPCLHHLFAAYFLMLDKCLFGQGLDCLTQLEQYLEPWNSSSNEDFWKQLWYWTMAFRNQHRKIHRWQLWALICLQLWKYSTCFAQRIILSVEVVFCSKQPISS